MEAPFANLSYFCRSHAEECHFWCHDCARPCCDSCLRESEHHASHSTSRRDHDESPKKEKTGDRAKRKREEIIEARKQLHASREELKKVLRETGDAIMTKHREITTKVNNERERLLNELAQIERLTMEQLAKDEAALDEVESKFIKNIPQITPFALSVSLVDTPVKLGTITTCLVPSRTRAIGAGLEYATVESNEFRLHPRGWLDEPIGGFDLADFGVSITPNAKTVITAETGSILCSYQIGEKVDHVITITFRGAPIGQFAAAFQHERNYRELHGTVVGESGGGIGQFRRPWGICALPNGAVAISDRANNRVQIITREGRVALVHPPEAEHVQNPAPGEGLFNRPAGIAFTHCPTPSLIVADKDNHKIQVFIYIFF